MTSPICYVRLVEKEPRLEVEVRLKENEAMWSFLYTVWGVSFKSSKETLINIVR